MKKIIIVSASLLFAAGLSAQKIQMKDVPEGVRNAFKNKFPKAGDVKWEKEHGNYEAGFDVNKTETSALFDANGNWLETETEIAVTMLPAAVAEYVKTNHAGQKIKEAAKITSANGIITYEAEVKGKDLIFDSNGKFLKEALD